MNITLLTTLVATLGAASDDRAADVNVAAFLDAQSLTVGETYEFEVFIDLPGGAEQSPCFLQLDVPPSVELTGPRVTTQRELQQNDLLQAPFERMLREVPARVGFELVSEPAADATIGLNLVAYVRPEGETPFFLRRRLELPVEAGADAIEEEPTVSTWGDDKELLQIGSQAKDFELPRGDGSKVRLGDMIGEKYIVVTTYRAHW